MLALLKRYSHYYTWSEALGSMLYKEWSYMLIAIHVVKLRANNYTRSKALCPSL